MGGSESKDNAGEASSLFTSDERKLIHNLYDENDICKVGFKKILRKMEEQITVNLNQYVSRLKTGGHHKTGGNISVSQFKMFVGYILKGYVTEKAHIVKAMSSTCDVVKIQNLFLTVKQIQLAYKDFVLGDPSWNNWSLHKQTPESEGRFILHLLQELFDKGSSPHINSAGELQLSSDDRLEYSESEIEDWMSKTPLFVHNLKLYEKISSLVTVPYTEPIQGKPITSQLDINDITFINFHLLKDLQSEWRLVFSNSLYGDSFTQLLSRILNKGPTLLVIKDKAGHKFGGFCSKSWELNPKFFGTSDCFLFSLTHYGIYHTTLYNENFMYLNHGQQTLPNGLGMGGQFDYFGLWIDQSFNHGHSKAKPKCTTYGSPQLSSMPEFEVDMIEVWALGPEPKNEDSDDEHGKTTKKSILDKDPETKAMLTLIGKEQASEGFKERDDDEEMSEAMKKKMNTIPKLL